MPSQRIIVTGGATNIGRAVTEAFLAQGATVVVGQPDPRVADALVQRHGARVIPLRVDVSRPEQCRAFIDEAAARLGGLDVLVNNAAITGPGALRRLEELDPAHVADVFNVNIGGVLFCSQAALPHLRRAGGGVIVHISSINAIRPQRGAMVYAASKAAVSSLAQSMGRELAGDAIRVVAVAPGDIATARAEPPAPSATSTTNDVTGQTPLGQGQPEDIGAVVAFLCSPGARFVTGTTWIVDGGLLS